MRRKREDLLTNRRAPGRKGAPWGSLRANPAPGERRSQMRRFILAALLGAVFAAAPAGALAARNPSETGTGPPSQSCQEIEAAGGHTPGHANESPGSPFNEPEINSEKGGTG